MADLVAGYVMFRDQKGTDPDTGAEVWAQPAGVRAAYDAGHLVGGLSDGWAGGDPWVLAYVPEPHDPKTVAQGIGNGAQWVAPRRAQAILDRVNKTYEDEGFTLSFDDDGYIVGFPEPDSMGMP